MVQHHVVNTLQWPGLRPLQNDAVKPVLDGVDCLLLAPTAGGKTEAATFPLLSRMTAEGWTGIPVLYVCPLRALLNNLQPRIQDYAAWVGRSAALWHGDTGQGARRRILRERPDVLLTTPESLESMLVSATIDSTQVFADLRVVVVDEVHAFAGDDRGWHLLHIMERLAQLAGRPLQRIGLSATVGNPDDLLGWLQGATSGRPRAVVSPPRPRLPATSSSTRSDPWRARPPSSAGCTAARNGWCSSTAGDAPKNSGRRRGSGTSTRTSRTPRCPPPSDAVPRRPSPSPATA